MHTISILLSITALTLCATMATGQAQVVYPLHVGDRWEYLRTGAATSVYTREALYEETVQNGSKYPYLYPSPYFGGFLAYQRAASSKVYFYYQPSWREFVVFDFTRAAGAQYAVPCEYAQDGSGTVMTSGPLNSDSLFGLVRRSWRFDIDWIPGEVYDDEWVYIVDSIGVVKAGGQDWRDSLLGAVVGGITFGTVTVDVPEPESRPASYTLSQNYPNPFNPTTTIDISLNETTSLTLKIFNVLGEEVATLASGVFHPGNFRFPWTPIDCSGGVYYYRLQTNDYWEVRKLLYAR